MSAACLAVRYRSRRLDPGDLPDGGLGRHARSCLRCQAEAARSGSLQRRLAALADEVLAAPAGIPEAVQRIVELPPAATGPATRGRIRAAITVAAAGAAMAATAGTLAAVGWWAEGRRLISERRKCDMGGPANSQPIYDGGESDALCFAYADPYTPAPGRPAGGV